MESSRIFKKKLPGVFCVCEFLVGGTIGGSEGGVVDDERAEGSAGAAVGRY